MQKETDKKTCRVLETGRQFLKMLNVALPYDPATRSERFAQETQNRLSTQKLAYE